MIQKSVFLSCSIEEAFKRFTERVSEWWPPTHRPSKDPESSLYLEEGGRFWERARDGREAELGRVLSWEPPNRLRIDFYIGSGPEKPTDLEVMFAAEDGGTRVRIHHRSKAGSEDIWTLRAPVFDRSWDAVLAAFANR